MHKIGIRVPGARLDNQPSEFISNLNLVKEIGFKAIELCPEDFDAISCGNLDDRVVSNLNAILKFYDFEISVHVPNHLNLFNRDDPLLHKKVLESCLEFVSITGGKTLVYHPGRYIDNVEFARYGKPDISMTEKARLMKFEAETLKELSVRYPDITIAMENHRPYIHHSPYSYAERIDELHEQAEAISSDNVGIMIDTGHLLLASNYFGYDSMEIIRKRNIMPVHFHINDNHGIATYHTEKDKKSQHPFGRGDEHIVPGTGIFPFMEFFSEFEEYKGNFVIELTERLFYPAAIKKSFEFVSDVLCRVLVLK